MLTIVQLPFTDVRPFLASNTRILPWPTWPTPRADVEYIRSFGAVRERRRGGILEWPAEEIYSDASRAVRLVDKRVDIKTSDTKGQVVSPCCAFRRFMVDGRFPSLTIDGKRMKAGAVVSRLEIGLEFKREKPRDLLLTSPDLLNIIRAVTHLPVRLQREKNTAPLVNIGRRLAAAYLAASTRRISGKKVSTQAWWYQASVPLIVIEYHKGDVKELPKHSRHISDLDKIGIQLHHCRVESSGLRFGVWFVGLNDADALYDERDRIRRLRINLLRLHAERESVKQVLRLIAQEQITIKRGTTSSERLQEYLDESIRLLGKKDRDGLPQSDILDAAQDYEDLISPGEKQTLSTQLSSIRKTLLQRVEKITQDPNQRSGLLYEIHANEVIINHEQNGTKTVNTQTINFGSGNTITDVPIVAAKTIQDSWNRVPAANTKPELRTALQDLHKSVAEMTKQLPEQKQKEVATDLATLSSEASSPAPRKKWYELSAEGLLEAAKTVGEMATPVITAVKAVLSLLS